MPYAEMDVSHASLNGYSETGGSSPATFGVQQDTRAVSRLGEEVFDAASIPQVEVRGRAAWCHLFGDGGGFSANVTGLGTTVPFGKGNLDWAEGGVTVLYKPGRATTIAADLGTNIGRSDEPAVTGTLGVATGF
jgi:outer membrane autotransporter protein